MTMKQNRKIEKFLKKVNNRKYRKMKPSSKTGRHRSRLMKSWAQVMCPPPFSVLCPFVFELYGALFSFKARDSFSYISNGRNRESEQVFEWSESERRKFRNRKPILPHFPYLNQWIGHLGRTPHTRGLKIPSLSDRTACFHVSTLLVFHTDRFLVISACAWVLFDDRHQRVSFSVFQVLTPQWHWPTLSLWTRPASSVTAFERGTHYTRCITTA